MENQPAILVQRPQSVTYRISNEKTTRYIAFIVRLVPGRPTCCRLRPSQPCLWSPSLAALNWRSNYTWQIIACKSILISELAVKTGQCDTVWVCVQLALEFTVMSRVVYLCFEFGVMSRVYVCFSLSQGLSDHIIHSVCFWIIYQDRERTRWQECINMHTFPTTKCIRVCSHSLPAVSINNIYLSIISVTH